MFGLMGNGSAIVISISPGLLGCPESRISPIYNRSLAAKKTWMVLGARTLELITGFTTNILQAQGGYPAIGNFIAAEAGGFGLQAIGAEDNFSLTF